MEPAPPPPAAYYTAPSRAGKVAVNVYLEADFKKSLRLLQAHSGRSLQAIIAEALNDAFAKHGVPTVTEGTPARQAAAYPAAIGAQKAKGKPSRQRQGRARP